MINRVHSENIPQALIWVDEFISNVRPYIFVRLEDNLLIKRPNRVTRLNPTGAKILVYLLSGHSCRELVASLHNEPQRISETANFLKAIRDDLQGELHEFSDNPAVTRQPFAGLPGDYPVLSEVALTYRCNLRCNFCYAGCNHTVNPTGSNEEMEERQVRIVLDKIFHQAQVPSVSFTGGEPTLVPGLCRLITYAKNLGMRVNLISNGTLITDELAARLADSGLDSAQISIEGTCDASHDTIVGKDGAFARTIQAIARLKKHKITVHSNTTITRSNFEEAVNFPHFVRHILGNQRFSMNLVIPTGSSALNDHVTVSYQDAARLLPRIIDAAKHEQVDFMWYSPIPLCEFNTIVHGLGNKGCSACDGLLSVGANGDILPCASYDDPVGNLLHKDFKDIWRSPKACYYRNKEFAASQCKDCENFTLCNGACPLYWRQLTPLKEK